MTGHDNVDQIDYEIYDENEGNVGFGSPDLYYIKELIELLTEDPCILIFFKILYLLLTI